MLHGMAAVASVPLLLGLPLILVLGVWMLGIALGLDYFPIAMAELVAIPPISTALFDLQLGNFIFGLSLGTLVFTIVATVLRSAIWALLVGMIVESVEFRTQTSVGLLRGVAAFPAVLVVNLLHLLLIYTSNLVLPAFLGPSVGQLAFTAALVGGLYLLTFAPIVAVRGGATGRQAIRRSVRGSLLPGPRHLILVLVYFLLVLGVLLRFVPGLETFTANPSVATWMVVLFSNYLHLAFLGAFAYRWVFVENQVGDEPLRRERRRTQPARRSRAR
jgi:hypothetical protein